MRVAIIGSSGASIGGLFARAGHEVVFSGSRDPRKLVHAAELAGPKARTATVGDAVDQAEVVVMAVPFERYPDVAREVGEALRGKVVVDTSNAIAVRDGQVEFLDVPDGLTPAQYQRSRLGDVRLVKAFNMLCPSSILELASRTGEDRVAVPFVGDDPAAKETVAGLIEDAGFAPVDAGGLDARALDPNSADDPRWGTGLTEREARRLVGERVGRRTPEGRVMHEMNRERQERSDLEDPACLDGMALSGLASVVRAASFRAILATRLPWDPDDGSVEGADPPSVRSAVDQLVETGRARTDKRGRVTASGGLSVDPTPHRVRTSRGARWTQCAYDALGILAALGEDGAIETTSPSNGAPIRVRFVDGRPAGSEAVLFLADQSSCCRPNDEWCPNVNLFEDRLSALRWQERHGIAGRVLTLDQGTELGAIEWRPLIGGAAGPHE